MAIEAACRPLAEALRDHLTRFADAVVGIAAPADRSRYARLWLHRLLLIYDLQVAGFLGQGDRWYLHNHLGHSQQHQPDQFFTTCLQPLCHHGFGLPASERPLPLQTQLGPVPFLSCRLFHPHPLEQQYPLAKLPDEPLEGFLGWLVEWEWVRSLAAPPAPHTLTRLILAEALEYLHTSSTGKGLITPPAKLQEICHQTLDAYVFQVLGWQPVPEVPLDTLLSTLTPDQRQKLLVQGLPALTVLDPACGSGRFLVMAFHRLVQFYQLVGKPDLVGKAAAERSQPALSPGTWHFGRHLLTHNLYGVDHCPVAVETTQLQLWLALLSLAPSAADLSSLPDLDFNITVGNTLMGFIRVDEASFDKIVPKRPRFSVGEQAPAPGPMETILQGNLLQPLTAANYRDTLAEKQIRVEHYRVQTQAMAEIEGIPEYVQTEFLRDRIEEVNQAAQQKLNRLLFETCSQQLGIRVAEPQPSGRLRKRLLTLADIEALTPFHWGFFFNSILTQRGGFDVILTHPPSGTLRPQADEFYHQQAALFYQYQIAPETWRRSRRAILQRYPDLAKAWGTYAGRYASLRDYFRRSDDYSLPATAATRSLSLKTLFAQRCTALSRPNGIPPYLYSP